MIVKIYLILGIFFIFLSLYTSYYILYDKEYLLPSSNSIAQYGYEKKILNNDITRAYEMHYKNVRLYKDTYE